MNKLSWLLSVLLFPVVLSAQTTAPDFWRKTKTCPPPNTAQNEFYKTLESSRYVKDTRYLLQTCKTDIADENPLYRAAFSVNYPATKYLLSKMTAPEHFSSDVFRQAFFWDAPAQRPADFSQKNWDKICNLAAENLIQNARPALPALFYAAKADDKAFKKLYKYEQKRATLSPDELSDLMIHECFIWQAGMEINGQNPNTDTLSFTNENMQKSCRFLLKHAPKTSQETLRYVLTFHPELTSSYLNKNTPPWVLARAAEVAPKQHRQLLEKLGAKAKSDALLTPYVLDAETAEFLIRLGAKPNAIVLEKFIEQDNERFFAAQAGWEFGDNSTYQIIQVLLEHGASPELKEAQDALANRAASPDTKQLLRQYGTKSAVAEPKHL